VASTWAKYVEIEMKLPFLKKKEDYKQKYEYEKARADAAEKELITLASELQDKLNEFSIFRRKRVDY
jgi:hypothetical protein|tara:strand:- start:71 stop:271 length:201 start_codon:yes stop_codon:yes gene_type:complete